MNTVNTIVEIPKRSPLQPKTAFSLYLNLAEHNIGIAIGNILNVRQGDTENFDIYLKRIEPLINDTSLSKLEKRHFPFLRTDKTDFEKKKEILFKLLYKLDELRNFFSHYYHHTTPFYFNDEEIKTYLENKFTEACDGLLKNYKPEELAHINIIDDNYCFFREATEGVNKYYFARNQKALVFLASFFLNKRQTNILMGKTKGFKKAIDKPTQATRDTFTYFCMKNESSFVSEDTSVRFFIDAISHLSKMPQELIGHLNDNALVLKLTNSTITRIKNLIFPAPPKNPKEKKKVLERKDIFDKLKDLNGKEFTSAIKFLEEVEKKIGNKNIKDYKHIIIEQAQESFDIRTDRDRFTRFALQYIDDFNLLPNIRFKVYTGRESKEKETKVYHDKKTFEREAIKRETIYSRINDRRKKDVEEDYRYQYVIRNNNVFFEYQDESQSFKGSLSIHEIRNLVFALYFKNLQKDAKSIQDKILDYLQQYSLLYQNIKDGKGKTEIKQQLTISEKYLPAYLQNWLNSEEYTTYDFITDVITKLEYTVQYAGNFLKTDGPKYYKNLRKHDKIKEILLFVNHNVSKYIDQEQYQQLEIYLGTFPKFQNEMLDYLKSNQINASCTTAKEVFNFHTIVKDAADLDSILNKTLNATIIWGKEQITNIKKKPDTEFVKTIAKMVNVSPKEYSDTRIKENITKFLEDNIILPRGFVYHDIFKIEKATENISLKINKRFQNLGLCDFYNKLVNYKHNKSAYKEFGKTIEEIKTKDKMLLVMAKDYLEKKITLEGKAYLEKKNTPEQNGYDLKIDTDIEEILKKNLTISIHTKKLVFGIKDYDNISQVLNDKRFEKILKNYFTPEQKEIYYINKTRYQVSEVNKDNRAIYDLQSALHAIEREQIEIVDALLKLERQILIDYVSAKLPNIKRVDIEFFLDRNHNKNLTEDEISSINSVLEPLLVKIEPTEDPKKRNRIEARELLLLKGIPEVEINKIIYKYRNAAFHNGLPENERLGDGVDEVMKYF